MTAKKENVIVHKFLHIFFFNEGFDYVVEIREGDKICFGSSVVRDTSPIGKGLAPHQKRMTPEIFSTGPGSYNVENITSSLYAQLHKVRSKKGVGSLAGKTPRFSEKVHFRTPSPGRYDVKVKWKEGKQSMAPFGIQSKVRETRINNYPGPGTYDIQKISKCRRTRFMYNFGNPSMVHTVEIICAPIPVDRCQKCDNLCEGDYWHKDHILFLCQICWNEEKHTREIFSEQDLKQYKKIRNCGFMHNHEETTAAIKTLPQNKINKKLRLENYLDLYIKC
ncbi:hypothetical protein NQ318_000117 [Aromia moschata]|uniref:Uncharacterized protein n=1 Tax=Aromia moschata TaxID=1265417 RepID=A0AAV8XML1_9CUCU|nr:hypothetical protein NQ318_000117 [Aromia moschata]